MLVNYLNSFRFLKTFAVQELFTGTAAATGQDGGAQGGARKQQSRHQHQVPIAPNFPSFQVQTPLLLSWNKISEMVFQHLDGNINVAREDFQ